MDYIIRCAVKEDWEQIKSIYLAGIATENATFEQYAPDSFEQWIENAHASFAFVLLEGTTILGWCKISSVSNRLVYKGVGEVSIYVHPNAKGKGIGQVLLANVIKKSEEYGYWTLQAGIFPENFTSIELHKKNGFREVGYRERIGKMNGLWRDNLLLERRSKNVGIE